MTHPQRMNNVEVKIKRLDVAGSPKDPDFREAKRSKKFDPVVTVLCQVNFGSGGVVEDTLRTHTGDGEPSAGWLVFSMDYIGKLGWEPKKGDRVVEVAGRPMDFRVRRVTPQSPLDGRFLLLYVILEEPKEDRSSL